MEDVISYNLCGNFIINLYIIFPTGMKGMFYSNPVKVFVDFRWSLG